MSSADELQEKLQNLWKKALPLMLRRLNSIERAHKAIVGGALNDAMKAEAAQEAHKLAGSLGVFGLSGGSESALEIERILSSTDRLSTNDVANLGEHLQRLGRDINSGT